MILESIDYWFASKFPSILQEERLSIRAKKEKDMDDDQKRQREERRIQRDLEGKGRIRVTTLNDSITCLTASNLCLWQTTSLSQHTDISAMSTLWGLNQIEFRFDCHVHKSIPQNI